VAIARGLIGRQAHLTKLLQAGQAGSPSGEVEVARALSGDEEASLDIKSLAVIAGELPVRARRLVVEWASVHQFALLQNWERARNHRPLSPVEPLR